MNTKLIQVNLSRSVNIDQRTRLYHPGSGFCFRSYYKPASHLENKTKEQANSTVNSDEQCELLALRKEVKQLRMEK